MLYNVHYTTRQTVTRYNAKGKMIGQYDTDIPHTLTALPMPTALQYKTCDNFRMEPYVPERRERHRGIVHQPRKDAVGSAPRPKKPARPNATQKAAATGDLAAAINGGM